MNVEIDSMGGDSGTGLDVAEILLSRETVCTVTGNCFSSAVQILCAGRQRRILQGASVMILAPSAWVFGGTQELQLGIRNLWGLRVRLMKFLRDRTGQPAAKVAAWLQEDNYFTPEQAMEAGLVDEILPQPTCGTSQATEGNSCPRSTADQEGFTDGESLLLNVLRAIGRIETHDARRLRREVGAWLGANVKSPPSAGQVFS